MESTSPRLRYAVPALVATPATIVLAVVSLVVGPIHACEECPGNTGASPAQTDLWLWTLAVSAVAVVVAWAVAAAVIHGIPRDERQLRVVPLRIVILAAALPVMGAGIAVAINAYSAAFPAGYRS